MITTKQFFARTVLLAISTAIIVSMVIAAGWKTFLLAVGIVGVATGVCLLVVWAIRESWPSSPWKK